MIRNITGKEECPNHLKKRRFRTHVKSNLKKLIKLVRFNNPSRYSTCLNGIMSNISLSTFMKANVHTFPRYLSKTSDHLLYIQE